VYLSEYGEKYERLRRKEERGIERGREGGREGRREEADTTTSTSLLVSKALQDKVKVHLAAMTATIKEHRKIII
jgi:hypothetical protein